jgi:hypothetical protein
MKESASCLLLLLLSAASEIFASGQRSVTLRVSAVVRPAARLEVHSPTSVTAGVTMYPNTQALVWAANGACGEPENPKLIPDSGFHNLSFSPEEVQGKDRVCLTSSDGVLKTSVRLPQ